MLAKQHILDFAARSLRCDVSLLNASQVSGGDINICYHVTSTESPYNLNIFIKTNSNAALLKSEHDALGAIHQAGVSHYPKVLAFENIESAAVLALEYIKLEPLNEHTAASAGEALAKQHNFSAEKFGWQQNGHIGHSHQRNTWHIDWTDFFVTERLQPQLSMARDNRLELRLAARIELLMKKIVDLIDCNNIKPALLHGDLWQGNLGFDAGNKLPVFYDPAPYFGDSEADIAMTMLFGSMPSSFYQHYRALRPEPGDFDTRVLIYNLYHALNHFNLFGSGYHSLVERLCNRAL